MMEANKASSSAKDVSITTLAFGCLARISRVASMPLPSIRRTSITTTSGRVRSASSIASRTDPASPETTMSSAAWSKALTPLLTTSWSSTSRTRSGGSPTQDIVPAGSRSERGLRASVVSLGAAELDGDGRGR